MTTVNLNLVTLSLVATCNLSLVFLLISDLINRLRLHQFLGTYSPQ